MYRFKIEKKKKIAFLKLISKKLTFSRPQYHRNIEIFQYNAFDKIASFKTRIFKYYLQIKYLF